jgi:rifampicin phosphotransferase
MPKNLIYCLQLTASAKNFEIGGKAANLVKASTLGIHIPDGFVVTRQALTGFLEENGLMASVKECIEQDWKNKSDEQQRYDRLCSTVLASPIPDTIKSDIEVFGKELFAVASAGLAVRSSSIHEDTAAASFAGVFKSFLGVSTMETLCDKIRLCWCSAWTPQAIRYARRKRIEIEPDSMAVIVQEVIPAESAGLIFTADPLTGNPWRFILNATWGLAEGVVDGEAAADQFVLEWDTAKILERQIAEKSTALISDRSGLVKEAIVPSTKSKMASLSASEVSQIHQMALKLDNAFDQRLDIEWAMHLGNLYVVQARPIVALPSFFPHKLSSEDAKITWTLSDPAWYISAEEGKHLVAPLFRSRWALELWHRNLEPGDIFPRRVGYERDFNGYRYSTNWEWATSRNDPAWIEQWLSENEVRLEQAWLAQKSKVVEACQRLAEAQQQTRRSTDLIALLLECYQLEEEMQAAVWAAPQWMFFTCDYLLKELIQEIAPGSPYEKLLQGLPSYSYERAKAAQELGHSIKEDIVRAIFVQEPPETLLAALVERCPHSRFMKDFTALCWQFGICPPNLPKPWSRWSQDSAPTLFMIKSAFLNQAQDVSVMLAKSIHERKTEEKILHSRVSESNRSLVERLDRILTWTYFWIPVLDDRSWHFVIMTRLADLMRQTGEALVQEGLLDHSADILLLTVDHLMEIAKIDDVQHYHELYLAQKHEFEQQKRLTPLPFLGTSLNLTPSEHEAHRTTPLVSSKSASFQGQGFSPGRASGISIKMETLTDQSKLSSLTSEHILVCPKAKNWRPDWLSLFLVVKGLITVGGVQLQHATQIARECGIPFVNLPEEDWKNIPDNTRIVIDAEAGLVTILK